MGGCSLRQIRNHLNREAFGERVERRFRRELRPWPGTLSELPVVGDATPCRAEDWLPEVPVPVAATRSSPSPSLPQPPRRSFCSAADRETCIKLTAILIDIRRHRLSIPCSIESALPVKEGGKAQSSRVDLCLRASRLGVLHKRTDPRRSRGQENSPRRATASLATTSALTAAFCSPADELQPMRASFVVSAKCYRQGMKRLRWTRE